MFLIINTQAQVKCKEKEQLTCICAIKLRWLIHLQFNNIKCVWIYAAKQQQPPHESLIKSTRHFNLR
jgi:hypothetical protein